jgi:uncharacterized LabA/DUF88 family protein
LVSEKPRRVWVLIDGQNAYRDARRSFHDEKNDPPSLGQFHPHKLAQMLADRGPEDETHPRELTEVRVYVGVPSSSKQSRANAAHLKQRAAWLAAGVKPVPRPLRYPEEWPKEPAQEKGIDVSLAVDLVFGAARRFYDIGVVVSTDTDLVPALEAVCDLQRAWGTPRIEVASWKPTGKRLRVDGRAVWCHWLDESDYLAVQDKKAYAPPRK